MNTVPRSSRGVLRLVALTAALGLTLPPATGLASGYEEPTVLEASKILPPALLRGEHYRTAEAVQNDGYLNTYTIASDYGTFEVEGTVLLHLRVKEIGAITQLEEVNKAAVAAGAVVDWGIQLGESVVNVVTKPRETAEGIPGGVKRTFSRLGRKLRRTAEKVQDKVTGDDEPTADANEPQTEVSTRDKAAKVAAGVGRSVFGVSAARRRWAQKLGVDPYTTNEALSQRLEKVAAFDAAGRFATKLLPASVLLSTASKMADVNELVWSQDPDELMTLNEKRLKQMGVSGGDSRELRLNKHLSLTWQTTIVAALDALEGVEGRPDFIARAAQADSEEQAVFYATSALMLQSFHASQAPLKEIVPGTHTAVALAQGNRLIQLLPVDHLLWTEELAASVDADEATRSAKHGKARKEMWLTGSISRRARRELGKRHWSVLPGRLRDRTLLGPEPGKK